MATAAELLHVEMAIREVERAYDAAWQAGDLNGILACLSPDAVLINPYGDVAEVHSQIRSELAKVLGAPAASRMSVRALSRTHNGWRHLIPGPCETP